MDDLTKKVTIYINDSDRDKEYARLVSSVISDNDDYSDVMTFEGSLSNLNAKDLTSLGLSGTPSIIVENNNSTIRLDGAQDKKSIVDFFKVYLSD